MSTYSFQHLAETAEIVQKLQPETLENRVNLLADLRERAGRLFFLGVGGSAANASHAVNDFRKIAGIESYAPTDNVSELTARTNDEGWASVFAEWLKGSRLRSKDALQVVIWHLLVSHPKLKIQQQTKWEAIEPSPL
jgi:D-sedoheptulose 7-phosphate isomerase